jgi:putative ABC transport system permease protein
MLRLTLAQMRRSLGRLTAAAIAIAIGTGFVAATLLTGNVITRSSYDSVTAMLAQADLVVDGDASGRLETIRAVDGVAAADPIVQGGIELRHGGQRSWQIVLPVASTPSLSSLTVPTGEVPTADDEIALPADAAERIEAEVGDTVSVTYWVFDESTGEGADETAELLVTGLTADPGGAWTGYGGAAMATLDSVVTWSGGSEDVIGADGVLVATEPGAASDDVRADIAAAVPSADVLTRDQAAEARIEELGGGENFLVAAVLGFAAISLVVAALVIANTFQVIVAQRTRTLALLRCVGATRSQLRRSVLLEAGILGLGASVLGVLLGTGIAQGALSVLRNVQDDMPLPRYVPMSAAVLVAPLVVGVIMTVLAALVPARAATLVSPVAALRPMDAPAVGSRAGTVRLVIALLLGVGGTAGLVLAVVGSLATGSGTALWLALGILSGAVSFVGVLVGAVFWVPRTVSLVGRLLGRAGPTARLAAANTVRNPRRTAATSTALLIGVTLVALMSTGAASARASLGSELDEQYQVDIAVTSANGEDLAPDVLTTVADVSGVERAVDVPSMPVTVGGSWYTAHALTDEVASVLRDGAVADAVGPSEVVVPSEVTDESGEPVTSATVTRVDSATGEPATGGATPELDTVVLPSATFADAFLDPRTFESVAGGDVGTTTVWAQIAADADAVAVVDDVREALGDESVIIESPVSQRVQYEQAIDTLLAIVVALLGVAVLIALVGVANTLSLSVIERRRESATLRAIGLTRRRLRISLATEGVLIAGVGAVLGAVIGVLYGWAGAAVVFGGLGSAQIAVPWRDLGLILVVALAAGLLASVLPARSAVRTPPVAALAVD